MEIKLSTPVSCFFESQYAWAESYSVVFTRAAVTSRPDCGSFSVQLGNESGWSDGARNEAGLVKLGISSADIEALKCAYRELGEISPEDHMKKEFGIFVD